MVIKKILLKYDLFYFVYNTFNLNRRKIVGKNNIIKSKKVLLKNLKISIKGNNNKIILGEGVRLIDCKITVYGNDHTLEIMEDCRLRKTEFWFEDTKCRIEIGKGTTIEGAKIASAENSSQVIIGEDCMFSEGIRISTTDSHSIVDVESGDRINKAKNVSIGSHVWLGAYSKILKGVNISDNAVIGIGSVVASDVSSNSVVAGVPAKIIKTNIIWLRERI